MHALLDVHVLDYILDEGQEALGAVLRACDAGRVTLYPTHLLRDELDAMPLDRGERWARLEALRARLPWAEPVPTAGFVLGTSRLDGAALLSWSDVETLDGLIGPNPENVEDALLAMTALRDGLTLVTNDRRATNRATAAGVAVMTPREFVRACYALTADEG